MNHMNQESCKSSSVTTTLSDLYESLRPPEENMVLSCDVLNLLLCKFLVLPFICSWLIHWIGLRIPVPNSKSEFVSEVGFWRRSMNKNTSYHKGIWSRFAAKGQEKVSVCNCLNSMTQHQQKVAILIGRYAYPVGKVVFALIQLVKMHDSEPNNLQLEHQRVREKSSKFAKSMKQPTIPIEKQYWIFKTVRIWPCTKTMYQISPSWSNFSAFGTFVSSVWSSPKYM